MGKILLKNILLGKMPSDVLIDGERIAAVVAHGDMEVQVPADCEVREGKREGGKGKREVGKGKSLSRGLMSFLRIRFRLGIRNCRADFSRRLSRLSKRARMK